MTGRTNMELERFRSLLDAYGAAPERWPEEERAAATALLADSVDARTFLSEAALLDKALDLVEAPAPSPELARRVEGLAHGYAIARPQRPNFAKPSLAHRLRAWRAAWRPAVLAASGALGLAVGIAAAQPPQTSTAFDTVELSALAGGLADLRAAELFEDQ